MAQNGDPGQPAPCSGGTAVCDHFPPLFGPQMSRYVSGPQRGKCVADLGLVPGEKKLEELYPSRRGSEGLFWMFL